MLLIISALINLKFLWHELSFRRIRLRWDHWAKDNYLDISCMCGVVLFLLEVPLRWDCMNLDWDRTDLPERHIYLSMAQRILTLFLYGGSASIESLESSSRNMHHYASQVSHQSKIERLQKIRDYSSTRRHGNRGPTGHGSAGSAYFSILNIYYLLSLTFCYFLVSFC